MPKNKKQNEQMGQRSNNKKRARPVNLFGGARFRQKLRWQPRDLSSEISRVAKKIGRNSTVQAAPRNLRVSSGFAGGAALNTDLLRKIGQILA